MYFRRLLYVIAGDFFVMCLFFHPRCTAGCKEKKDANLVSFFGLKFERKVDPFRAIRFGLKIYLPSFGNKT